MKISIIGAGIGGVSLGIALEKAGFETAIYEQFEAVKPVGAGIWVASNAMQVFGKIGLDKDIIEKGFSISEVRITNDQLKIIQATNFEKYKEVFGYSTTAIGRPDLLNVLLEAYKGTLHLGKQFKECKDFGDGVVAYFEDGSEVKTDLLIGADGIGSNVRKNIFQGTKLRYSGQTCWRGIAKMSWKELPETACVEAWGKGIRFGFSPINDEEIYWFAVAKVSEFYKVNPMGHKDLLLKKFKDFHPIVGKMITATDGSINRHHLYDLKPMKSWHKGRVCLMGDAAHATTPNMGQGGGQAIEDVWALSQLLQKHNYDQAFQQFEKRRRPKVNRIVNMSWNLGKIAHIPYGRGIRNFILRSAPASMADKQLRELYDIGTYE